jgi:hypothetical protein
MERFLISESNPNFERSEGSINRVRIVKMEGRMIERRNGDRDSKLW